jgi:hypothetical protein
VKVVLVDKRTYQDIAANFSRRLPGWESSKKDRRGK